MKHNLEDVKFQLLASSTEGLVGAETYMHWASSLPASERGLLPQFLEDAGLDIAEGMSMVALYHHQPGRQYKPSKREKESGKFECPACKIYLVRVTRKAKDPLFRCSTCGWAIAKSDIYSPDGVEVIEVEPGAAEGPW